MEMCEVYGRSLLGARVAEMLLRSRPEPRAPTHAPTPVAPASDDPLKVLQMRFVKSEITKEQYEEMKQFLEGS